MAHKHAKTWIALLLSLALSLSFTVPALALAAIDGDEPPLLTAPAPNEDNAIPENDGDSGESEEEWVWKPTQQMRDVADMLYNLHLFRGVGTNEDGTPDFALDLIPTRIQGLIILLRLTGVAEEAENYEGEHPFTDVPEWANGYVAYAWANGLTNGISETEFNPDGEINAEMFCTFILRALGYEDGVDFAWENATQFARLFGISAGDYPYRRGDVVEAIGQALLSNLKGSTQSLYEKLIDAGVFTGEEFDLDALWETTNGAALFEHYDSYDAALAYLNEQYSSVKLLLETDTFAVAYCTLSGTPHGGIQNMYLLGKAGSAMGNGALLALYLPRTNFWGAAMEPDDITVDEDGLTVTYSFDYGDFPLFFHGGNVLARYGPVRFTVKLDTGLNAINYDGMEIVDWNRNITESE